MTPSPASLPYRAAFLKTEGYSPLFGQSGGPLLGLWLSWARGCCLEHRAPSSRDSSSCCAAAWSFKDCSPVRWGTVLSESISGPCTQTECCPLAPSSGGDLKGPQALVLGTSGHPYQQGCLIVSNCTLGPPYATHSAPSSQHLGRNIRQDKGGPALPLNDIPWCLPVTLHWSHYHTITFISWCSQQTLGQKGPESDLILEVGITAFATFLKIVYRRSG